MNITNAVISEDMSLFLSGVAVGFLLGILLAAILLVAILRR
jgi:hypothetical protein